ncbi:hypothetical protein AHiyo8_pI69400 (plasmid) [Arthrobacter sp. Hiyo8]|nr:hypothetical protein AHiyo8_pI69400 [Arthrobacter sp. Hiyo8]
MLEEFLLRPEKLIYVGREVSATGPRVLPDCAGVGDASSVAEFGVDITQRVDILP